MKKRTSKKEIFFFFFGVDDLGVTTGNSPIGWNTTGNQPTNQPARKAKQLKLNFHHHIASRSIHLTTIKESIQTKPSFSRINQEKLYQKCSQLQLEPAPLRHSPDYPC